MKTASHEFVRSSFLFLNKGIKYHKHYLKKCSLNTYLPSLIFYQKEK